MAATPLLATDRPPVVVAKYGGSSLATPEHIGAVADLLAAERADGPGVSLPSRPWATRPRTCSSSRGS